MVIHITSSSVYIVINSDNSNNTSNNSNSNSKSVTTPFARTSSSLFRENRADATAQSACVRPIFTRIILRPRIFESKL